jgi:hypothetical protein
LLNVAKYYSDLSGNAINSHRLKVFRRTFGQERDEVTGGWRKLHNEELHNLYSSPNIIRMIKSRRIKWAGHGGKARRKVTTGKTKT